MTLEDNINKEHLRTILSEYDKNSNYEGIENAIKQIGYPDRYSTFLLLSILSEWAFTNKGDPYNYFTLRYSQVPNLSDIMNLSLGSFYNEVSKSLTYRDKPTEDYRALFTSFDLDANDLIFYDNKTRKFIRNEIEFSDYVKDLKNYFESVHDGVKSEFMRALNVAEKWLDHNENLSALFLDYALLRLDWNKDIDYIKSDEKDELQNSPIRKKILRKIRNGGINVLIRKTIIPDELFSDHITNLPSNVYDEDDQFFDEFRKNLYGEQNTEKSENKEEKKQQKEFRQKIVSLDDHLKDVIFEQDHAIEEVHQILLNKEAGIGDQDKAYGLLFAGPTGVGKTELARQLNSYLFGNQEMLRIDCTEYAQEHYIARLIGSPPGYVGSNEVGLVAEFLRKNPRGVIVFDEVEKAHPKVIDYLLSLLDNKELTDNHKEPYQVNEAIILLTTNAGNEQELANKKAIGFNADQKLYSKNLRHDRIKNAFRPELLGRLNDIVHFNSLSYDGLVKIFNKKLKRSQSSLYEKSQIYLKITEAARDQIIEESDWETYGGRKVEKNLERRLTPFSKQIVKGDKVKPDDYIVLDYSNGSYDYYIESKNGAIRIKLT